MTTRHAPPFPKPARRPSGAPPTLARRASKGFRPPHTSPPRERRSSRDDIAVYRSGTFYYDSNGSGAYDTGDQSSAYGQSGDIAVAGTPPIRPYVIENMAAGQTARIEYEARIHPAVASGTLTTRTHITGTAGGSTFTQAAWEDKVTVNFPPPTPTESDTLGRYTNTAREWDAEIDLQYNRARYYDPATGRWISQDPLGFDAGDSNLYRYVNNRPTGATDPSGLEIPGRRMVGPLYPPVLNLIEQEAWKSPFTKQINEYQLGRTAGWYEDVIVENQITSSFLRLLSFIPMGKGTGVSQGLNLIAGVIDRSTERLQEEYQKAYGIYDNSPEAENLRKRAKLERFVQEVQIFKPPRLPVKMQGRRLIDRQVNGKVLPTHPSPIKNIGTNLQVPGNGFPRFPAGPNRQGPPNVFGAAGNPNELPYLLRQMHQPNWFNQPVAGNPVRLPGNLVNRPAAGRVFPPVEAVNRGRPASNVPNPQIDMFQGQARTPPRSLPEPPPARLPALVPFAPVPTGQIHHPISTRVGRALDSHPTLRGQFQPRDPRFTTQAIDEAAHRGYQTWHRELDAEVVRWIESPRNATATPQQFLDWLRGRYSQPDLLARFPNGF